MHSPQVPASGRVRFRARLRTRWSDEDNQNVLNNAVFMTLFEEARHAYFVRLGLLEGNHFPFVLGATNVRFLAPGRGGVEIDVEVVTTSLGKSSFQQAYRVLEASGGRVWAEAEAIGVTIDPKTGGSRPMSELFRGAVAEFEGL